MIDRKTAKFWLEGREMLRTSMGQAIFLSVRKVQLKDTCYRRIAHGMNLDMLDFKSPTKHQVKQQKRKGTIAYKKGAHGMNLDLVDFKPVPEPVAYRQGAHGMNLDLVNFKAAPVPAYRRGAHGMNLD